MGRLSFNKEMWYKYTEFHAGLDLDMVGDFDRRVMDIFQHLAYDSELSLSPDNCTEITDCEQATSSPCLTKTKTKNKNKNKTKTKNKLNSVVKSIGVNKTLSNMDMSFMQLDLHSLNGASTAPAAISKQNQVSADMQYVDPYFTALCDRRLKLLSCIIDLELCNCNGQCKLYCTETMPAESNYL